MNNYLKGIRERCEKATEGPWMHTKGYFAAPELGRWIVVNDKVDGDWRQIRSHSEIIDTKADFDFIAHARTDLPLLLDCLEKAMGGLERLCSCEAFDISRVSTEEEQMRMQFAQQTLESIHKRLEEVQ